MKSPIYIGENIQYQYVSDLGNQVKEDLMDQERCEREKVLRRHVDEFPPEFVIAESICLALEELGFSDQSWHNDVSPHFDKEIDSRTRIEVWIAPSNREYREEASLPRFNVCVYDIENSQGHVIKSNENFFDVHLFLKSFI
jgi:hypothetical protein